MSDDSSKDNGEPGVSKIIMETMPDGFNLVYKDYSAHLNKDLTNQDWVSQNNNIINLSTSDFPLFIDYLNTRLEENKISPVYDENKKSVKFELTIEIFGKLRVITLILYNNLYIISHLHTLYKRLILIEAEHKKISDLYSERLSAIMYHRLEAEFKSKTECVKTLIITNEDHIVFNKISRKEQKNTYSPDVKIDVSVVKSKYPLNNKITIDEMDPYGTYSAEFEFNNIKYALILKLIRPHIQLPNNNSDSDSDSDSEAENQSEVNKQEKEKPIKGRKPYRRPA